MSRCSIQSLGGAQFIGGEGAWSVSGAATGSSCLQSGVGAFAADEVSFEFGEGGKDVEHEPTAGRAGVYVLLQGFELNALLLQCVHVVDEMADGPAETVHPPDHECVTGSDLIQELI